MTHVTPEQLEVCTSNGVEPMPVKQGDKVGIALNARSDEQPLYAIRHPPEQGTSGWYIWRGEQKSDPDFFVPLHMEHVAEWVPELMPYLALPPGWGIVLGPDYEDVFYDESFLSV